MSNPDNLDEYYYAAMASRSEGSTFSKKAAGSRSYTSNVRLPINGELNNIGRGVTPFEDSGSGVSIKDAIELCQKAYWNVAIFRSTVDIQSEFSNSKLHFKSANKRSANFFKAWYEKINGWSLGERFFREWFRSGNVFLFRFDGNLTINDYRKIVRAKKEEIIASPVTKQIPLRYIILNPTDMKCMGSASFVNAKYQKVLNDYERERLKNPSTPEEVEFFNSLPLETQKNLKNGGDVVIDLDADKLTAIFCGKQDYESMAVPMYYSVLPDINLKLEFKKAEQVIARTVDYAVLLITAGEEGRGAAKNNELIGLLTELFSSDSVGRVLVSDYTTKGEFLIPDLSKIFGSEKYKVVNEDIANGLMNIFWGDEKFANSMVKIQVFLERLNQAREAYLNYFLKPEMKRIAETLGLQEIPEVTFEQINLKDEIEFMKIYTRLAELGILTPEELFDAINSHELPLSENSIESQKFYKSFKDKGLYEPLLKSKTTDAGGRPTGTKAPKKVNVGPIGASVNEAEVIETFSVASIGDTLKEYFDLRNLIEDKYKDTNNIKRLSKKHKEICSSITDALFMQEDKKIWNESIEKYIENPFVIKNNEQTDEILSLATEHQLSNKLASVLFHSKQNNSVS